MITISSYFFPLIAFILALLAHYLIIDISHRKGLFLDSREKIQKAHIGATPRIGGLGIFLATLFMVKEETVGVYLMMSAIPVFLSGFLEDYSGKVSPLRRLIIMSLGPVMAIFFVSNGILTTWGGWETGLVAGAILTILLLAGVANGINFIDGQNGLAAGSVLINFITMLVIAHMQQDKVLVYLFLVMIAATLAFLCFNFPSGKIFLGDSGAYLLGFLLAALAVLLVERHKDTLSPMLLPLLLIYPLWEVTFSAFRKIFFDHIAPYQSDKYHLHQLIYRNWAAGKGYLPALIILPAQLMICTLAVLFPERSLWLFLFSLAFILLYGLGYFYLRKISGKEHKDAD